MNPASSIGLAVLSTTFFTLALGADQILVNKEAQYKTFYVDPHDEQVLEQEYSETARKLVAMESGQARLEEGATLINTVQGMKTAERKLLLEQRVGELRATKSYADIVNLLSGISADERIKTGMQFNYAFALSRTGEHQSAANAYSMLLSRQPNHQSAAVNLGLLNNKLHDYGAAEKAFRHAIEISSGSKKAKAHSGLATTLRARGKLQEAEVNFKKSIEYRPSHASTWLKLAEIQGQLNKPYQEVSMTYQRALSLRKYYLRAYKSYGLYQLDNLNYSSAIENLHKALETSNNDEDIYRGLAWAYFENFEQTNSGKYWRWLSSNARNAEDRLAASHMLAALRGQPSKLQQFKLENKELTYTHQVLTLLNKAPDAFVANQALLPGRDARLKRLSVILSITAMDEQQTLAWQTANLYQGEVQFLLASEARELGNYSTALNHINDAIAVSGLNRRNTLFKYVTLIESELHVEAREWLQNLPLSIQQALSEVTAQSLHTGNADSLPHITQSSFRTN